MYRVSSSQKKALCSRIYAFMYYFDPLYNYIQLYSPKFMVTKKWELN